jgi:hypothetical protein
MVQTAEDRDANDSGSHRWPRRGQMSGAVGGLHPKSAMGPAMIVAIDRVSVVDEESGDLLSIAGRLRDALGGPGSAWMFGDAGVDDGASAEGENDEDVKEAESRRDEDEEVAGPGLVRWLRMNVVQRWPRCRSRLDGRYLATVRGEIWWPSLANSAAMIC